MPSAPTPTRAAASTSGFSSAVATDDRAVAGDQAQAHDAAGDVAEVPAGAVGGGGGGAGDRLVGDVAHVLEGEAAQVELVAQRG